MGVYVLLNSMHSAQLSNALRNLAEAVRKVEDVLKEMQEERDPLALHIFVSRRGYRKIEDTKSGKRHETAALLSWQEACELGFHADLNEWERLMGARPQ